ncbi:MAG TPA: J domain-containing protein [Pyrinomonadaceae bacterium]|nr:J domain-containing protein [Pyrinomonadaceae bacterium]
MTANNLELNGNIKEFPVGELITEAVIAELSGSFRLSFEGQKVAVYLEKGAVVYAASNLRAHRLAECIVRSHVLSAAELSQFLPVPNDFELGKKLLSEGKLTERALREMQTKQTTDILRTALEWDTGDWQFSPLVRARESLHVQIWLPQLMVETARKMSDEFVARRFRFTEESFAVKSVLPEEVSLEPEEGFVLAHFDRVLGLDELQQSIGLPEMRLLRALYVLWLGGFVNRYNSHRAFSDEKIAQMLSAKVQLTQNEPAPKAPPQVIEEKPEVKIPEIIPEAVTETPEEIEKRRLEEFLNRVENAKTHYQVLGVGVKAEEPEIKRVYFSLAKQFHPDKFHQTGGEILTRLQNSFAKVAQAYETLKNSKSRELYDFKIRKMDLNAETDSGKMSAEAVFERGREAFAEENYAEAVTFLARAVHLKPSVARFHSAYAQALSVSPKFRHQAENEFMTALRLDPNNAEIRLAFAEFYIEQKLNKRAEGELRRVLTHDPNHAKARRLLDSLT